MEKAYLAAVVIIPALNALLHAKIAHKLDVLLAYQTPISSSIWHAFHLALQGCTTSQKIAVRLAKNVQLAARTASIKLSAYCANNLTKKSKTTPWNSAVLAVLLNMWVFLIINVCFAVHLAIPIPVGFALKIVPLLLLLFSRQLSVLHQFLSHSVSYF